MQQAGKECKRRWRGGIRKGAMVRTWAAQLEGFTAYSTSTFSFDLYTNKPQAEATCSMISECSETGKAVEGGWLPPDRSNVVEPHK